MGHDIGVAAMEIAEAWHHRATYLQRWHAHAGRLEIHCVFSGAISYEFTGAPPATIPGGAFLVVPAGVRHRAVVGGGTPSVRLDTRWYVGVDRSRLQRAPLSADEQRGLLGAVVRQPLTVQRMPPRLQRAARDLFRAADERTEPLTSRLAAWSFLVECAAVVQSGELLAPASGNVVDKVCAHIRAHCGEQLRMDDLVRFSGYSRRRLFTLFRTRTGLTPGSFLTRCRVDRALELMAQTPRPRLLDVALACGFSSASHFSAVFRTYVGETPRAHRAPKE